MLFSCWKWLRKTDRERSLLPASHYLKHTVSFEQNRMSGGGCCWVCKSVQPFPRESLSLPLLLAETIWDVGTTTIPLDAISFHSEGWNGDGLRQGTQSGWVGDTSPEAHFYFLIFFTKPIISLVFKPFWVFCYLWLRASNNILNFCYMKK